VNVWALAGLITSSHSLFREQNGNKLTNNKLWRVHTGHVARGNFATPLENSCSLILINSPFGILIMNFYETSKSAPVSTGYNKQ
jgi:hypothetical protein